MEIWKDIKGYEKRYQVSNLGRIKSLERTISTKYFNRKNIVKEKLLTPFITNCGYCVVTLFLNGKRTKHLVHRIVAETFLPNSNFLPFVNHIDENKLNNHVENLEWCTARYNVNYSNTIRKAIATRKRKISQFEKLDKFIKTYESAAAASRESGIPQSSITFACQGKYKTAGGYIWKYYEEN